MMSQPADFDDEWATPPGWARMYRVCGLQVVPSKTPAEDPQNFKRPFIAWQEFTSALIPQATFDRWYGHDGEHRIRRNMGLITGEASNGAFCVDLDIQKEGSQARQWWGDLLAENAHGVEPVTPSQQTGGGGRQLIFRAPSGWTAPTFKTAIGVDIRGQGGFMVAPPSMHTSGKAYEWDKGRGPWQVEIVEAPEWLIDAVEALKEQFGGAPTGASRERTKSDASKNAFGLDIDDREQKLRDMVWAAVVDMYREAPIQPPQAEQDGVKSRLWSQYTATTKTRLTRPGENGDLLEAEGRGWSELDRKWRYAMRKWDTGVRAAAEIPKSGPPPPAPFIEGVGRAAPSKGHEEIQPEGGQPAFDPWERYIAPSFPLETLPAALRDFVGYQAATIGADPAAIAMATLVACAGAIDQGFRLKMKKTGDWSVRPRLWCVLVGEPSSKKTPVIGACVRPLQSFESVGVEAYQRAYARWKSDKAEGVKEDEPPRPTRYIFNDITSEKLGDLLSRQDRGALVDVDELSGWIGAMDKYGGGKGSAADRGFWLQAYNGGPKTIDRLTRGETFIKNLCVSFIGGIQPDRLAQLTDLTTDGLLQRFLPVMMRRASYPQEVENDQPSKVYADLIFRMVAMTPAKLFFDEGAMLAADEFQRRMFDLELTEGLGKGFCTFVGKLTGLQGSLATVLHLAEDPLEGPTSPISERVSRAAIRILEDFAIPHALALYHSTTDGGEMDAMRLLASFVLTSPKERFTASDFTSNIRNLQTLGSWDVAKKVSVLVAGGWLEEDGNHAPAKAWKVVPGLRESLADRRENEMKRKAETMRRLKKIRDGVEE